jgi:hypothetical protein
MVKSRARLCVELGSMKPRWDAWCLQHGVSAGEGIRELVTVAIGNGHDRDDAVPGLRWARIGEHRERIEIRLTRSELEAVAQRAHGCGLTGNRWIVALIRAQLTHEPQLGEYEMRLLADSNQQLSMVRTLLGQLANRTVIRGEHENRVDPRGLDSVRQAVDAHLRTVARLLRANLDRWSR